MLGPEGGAVRLEFGAGRFVTCETPLSCLDGSGWVRISDAPCSAHPELVVVRTMIAGARIRLLLDTGGATLLSRRFFDAHALGALVDASGKNELIGSGGAAIPGRIVTGTWSLALGETGLATVTAKTLWIADAPAGPTAECYLDGALGADVLAECTLTIADELPLSAFVRCPGPPPH